MRKAGAGILTVIAVGRRGVRASKLSSKLSGEVENSLRAVDP